MITGSGATCERMSEQRAASHICSWIESPWSQTVRLGSRRSKSQNERTRGDCVAQEPKENCGLRRP